MPHDPPRVHSAENAPEARVETVGGIVRFVGAGPGPVDLMTLRALLALRAADVVVHDLLVHPSVLAEASAAAEIVPVHRTGREIGGGADPDGSDAGERTGLFLRDLALAGRRVVRLKGGDPTVFARLAEEMRPLTAAGVTVEIVPGVTAALAASAAAAIPLTSRSSASSLTLVTGHRAGDDPIAVDLDLLALLPGSLVFYMGVERLKGWSGGLIASGRSGETPVAVVSRCGWPEQRILRSTLAEVAGDAVRAAMTSPAVAIVGGVVGEGSGPSGGREARVCPEAPASAHPLRERRVLLVRPAGQSAELARLLLDRGAEPIDCPAIRITPPDSWGPLDEAIDEASSFDWIVFSSVNGVRGFVERLHDRGYDARRLGTARIAAVGPKTVESLAAAGLVCDLVPRDEHRAESLAALLLEGMPPAGRFLLVRADRGREVLADRLVAAGHHVVEAVAYRSVDVDAVDPKLMTALRSRPPDWIVLTSPAVAMSALRLFGEFVPPMRIATISRLTSETVRRLGFEPAAEAGRAAPEEIVGAIVEAMAVGQADAVEVRPSPRSADAAGRA